MENRPRSAKGGRGGGGAGDTERSRLMRIKVFKSLGVSEVGNQLISFRRKVKDTKRKFKIKEIHHYAFPTKVKQPPDVVIKDFLQP